MTKPIEFKLIDEGPDNPKQVLMPFFSNDEVKNTIQELPVGGFEGKTRELYQLFIPDRHQQLFLLGLGTRDQFSAAHLTFLNFARKASITGPGLLVDLRDSKDSLVYACAFGIALSNYSVGSYKTDENSGQRLETVELLVDEIHDQLEGQLIEALLAADVVKRIAALVDAPANVKTPQYLSNWAKDSAKEFNYHVEVLDKDALMEENLQALLAVGKGSENPPALIKAVYTHPDLDPGQIHLGLVGKGVTFDTGGISLKKPANMHYMKSDMGGAAAVMGAMELIARMRLPVNVAAVVPLAENSIDAHSVRPGDVIQSHAGKSIEVIDTDAEGRLILADALSYIQSHYQPEVLIDLATLTGNCIAALGFEAAGLLTNDDGLAESIAQAGQNTSEKVWRLPLWKTYQEAMESDIADIKNLSAQPVAGAITAAKFLEFFVKPDQRWAHLDIAGVAFKETEFAKMKSATGFGVRLLLELAKSIKT